MVWVGIQRVMVMADGGNKWEHTKGETGKRGRRGKGEPEGMEGCARDYRDRLIIR